MIDEAIRRAQWTPFLYLAGNGMLLGAIAADPDDVRVFLVVVGTGLAVSVAGAVYAIRVSGHADRRLRDEARDGSTELVAGERHGGTLAPAAVVRRRPSTEHPSFLAGHGEAVNPTSVVTMLTALAPEGARRAVALVPPDIGLRLRRREVVAVRLHPARPDVAVLDRDVDAAHLAQFEADPRWQTADLPATGGGRTLAFGLLGIVAGTIVGLALATLLS